MLYSLPGGQEFLIDKMADPKKLDALDSPLAKEAGDTQLEYASSLKLADEKGDYSGATAKTDTREIALVRKLDFRIMPIMWSMYFLNYVGDCCKTIELIKS